MTPSMVNTLRAMAAMAAGTGAAGKCATTMIWVNLGIQNDPAMKVVQDHIRMWFYLISTQMNVIRVAGNSWHYSGEGSLSPILQATQEAAEYAVLRVAAEHRNGDGIQSGIDLTVINQHKKYLRKQERYQDIGLLDTGLAGGYC